ncbi:PAP2 superfamily-domain-containing protein [Astrocystis sublimbata]|nr:PAP2 superfamily-domain-containing protein [Astrocystis sublimbata]
MATGSPRSQPSANSRARRLCSLCSTRDSYAVEKRPTFGQWIKVTWLDILTIVIVAALAIPAYTYSLPLGIRIFPLDVPMSKNSVPAPSSAIPPDFAYPYRPQTVSSLLAAIVAIATPVVVILLLQLRIRSFWDLNNAITGLLYAILLSSLFQSLTKAYVGGFRPNFYDVCQPDSHRAVGEGNRTLLNGIGFRRNMWTSDVCTTEDPRRLRNAMQGFPSGHTATMVAAMMYLCLYLNAKLKVFANYHTPLWKLIALILPLLGTVLLCGTLIIDHTHSWYDLAGGAAIGLFMSFAAFRVVYPSHFDWRINHIPLNRNVPFDGISRPEFTAASRAGWRSSTKGSGSMPTQDSSRGGHEAEDGT